MGLRRLDWDEAFYYKHKDLPGTGFQPQREGGEGGVSTSLNPGNNGNRGKLEGILCTNIDDFNLARTKDFTENII